MSTASLKSRLLRSTSKIAMILIAISFLWLPAVSENCVEKIFGTDTGTAACHAQTIMPVNMSFAVPAAIADAIVPAPAFTVPILALAMLIAGLMLVLSVPASITQRRRFLVGIWATSLPFKRIRLCLPYFSAPRDM